MERHVLRSSSLDIVLNTIRHPSYCTLAHSSLPATSIQMPHSVSRSASKVLQGEAARVNILWGSTAPASHESCLQIVRDATCAAWPSHSLLHRNVHVIQSGPWAGWFCSAGACRDCRCSLRSQVSGPGCASHPPRPHREVVQGCAACHAVGILWIPRCLLRRPMNGLWPRPRKTALARPRLRQRQDMATSCTQQQILFEFQLLAAISYHLLVFW